jgi:putative addiction module killer protein
MQRLRERSRRLCTAWGKGTSNVKNVGAGVSEYKINFGPGYRVYYGMDGDQIVILLGGGTKQRQQKDIGTGGKITSSEEVQSKSRERSGSKERNENGFDPGFQGNRAGTRQTRPRL